MTTVPRARTDSACCGNTGFTSLIFRGGLIPPLPPTRYGPCGSDADSDPEPVVASMPPPGTPPGTESVAPSLPFATTVSGAIVDGASIGAGASGAAGSAAGSECSGVDLAGFGSLSRDGAGRTSGIGLTATIAGITNLALARTIGTET